ncbi:MAG: response regulator [Chitinophagia bacterium]|nr:response regulator [Chitinophagia bacterium]
MNEIDNICIIDDDNIYTMLLKKTIKKLNICDNITSFNQGKLALETFKTHIQTNTPLPDIIFLDVNMPILDGWMFVDEFAKIMDAMNKKVLIYVVSASVDPDDKNKALANKYITNYLVKPIEIQTLLGIAQTCKEMKNKL